MVLRTARKGAIGLAAVALLAVSGCASTFPGPQNLPKDLFAAARSSPKAPHGFVDGVKRESCGEITLDQGESLPTDTVDCINAAIGVADAQLAVVAPTTEGDPVVTFYRTSASAGGVELFVDAEYDRFGSGSWTHETFPTATDITALYATPSPLLSPSPSPSPSP